MKRDLELLKNTIIIFIGKASTQLITFILLPLYTRYLSTSEYGMVDLILSYVTLLVPIIALQLEMAVFRFLIEHRNDEKEIKRIITTVIVLLIILITFFCLVYQIIVYFIDFKFKFIIILNIVSLLIYSVLLQICRGFGRNIIYSLASCLSGIFNIIISFILVIFLNAGALGVLIATSISYIFASIYMSIKINIFKYIKRADFSQNEAKELLKYSIPLIPDSISWWIVNASDRTIISLILSTAENGIYAVANKFSTIYTGVFNAFSMSWNESLSLHINDEDHNKYVSNIFSCVFHIFLIICLSIICILPFVSNIFITNEYAASYYHIPILLIAAFFNVLAVFLSAVYFAKKETKQIAKTSIMSAIINIVINIILINYIGLYAASLSTLFSYLFLFFYRYKDTKKYIKLEIKIKDVLQALIISIIIIILYYINNLALNIINILVMLLYLFICNKWIFKAIKNVNKNIKK